MKLKPFSPLDGDREWQFLQELEKTINGFGNDGNGVAREDFPAYLLGKIKDAHEIALAPHLVGQSCYYLTDGENLLGLVKLRHRLNEGLLEQGGNIGYAIHPDHRGKGYGKQLLALTLEKARLKGLDGVLITVNADNPASQKVALSCGGRLWKSTKTYHWYWIEL